MKKHLNKNQTICLLADILANDVKREGQYIYIDYVISVKKNITPRQALKTKAKEAKILYNYRKEHKLCIKCGVKHNTGMVKCRKCSNRAKKLLKKRS